jgi:triacylglycerol lipase
LVALVGVLVLVLVVVGGIRLVGGGRGGTGPAALPLPPQDRPGPVLLVPGYGGSRDNLLTLARRIEATGRTAEVLTLPGNGTGDLSAQVDLLDEVVGKTLAEGAPSVDVIGYSAGGVVAGLWVARDDGATKARRVITLGSPLAGTTVAAAAAASAPDACPAACRELAPGSADLVELADAKVGTAVPWLSIWSTDDRVVTPPDSARLDGAVNVPVQSVCPGVAVSHGGLPTDAAVTGLVLEAISPAALPTGGDCAALQAAGAG